MDAEAAHSSMSRQALESKKLQRTMLEILLGPGQLYEALKARGAYSQGASRT
jgi:type I restriction enzyme R subunit